jgi:hypothetical protein
LRSKKLIYPQTVDPAEIFGIKTTFGGPEYDVFQGG